MRTGASRGTQSHELPSISNVTSAGGVHARCAAAGCVVPRCGLTVTVKDGQASPALCEAEISIMSKLATEQVIIRVF